MNNQCSNKIKCKYGDKCYKTNAEHKKLYWHPKDDIISSTSCSKNGTEFKTMADKKESHEEYIKYLFTIEDDTWGEADTKSIDFFFLDACATKNYSLVERIIYYNRLNVNKTLRTGWTSFGAFLVIKNSCRLSASSGGSPSP